VGGRFEAVRSALANTAGVSNLKVPGQNFKNPDVKAKGQIIQYTGHAKAEDVIATLQKNIFFKVKVAERPKTKRGEQGGARQPATASESKSESQKKSKSESKVRSQ